MVTDFKVKLTLAMIADFALCFVMERGCKALFADLSPREMVTRGMERRVKRRAEEEAAGVGKALESAKVGAEEKKKQ